MNINNLEILEVEGLSTNNQEIESVEKNINKIIPNIYKQFLLLTNGAIMNDCVLYGTNSLALVDDIQDMKKNAPQYICIGNDNGDYELIMEAKEDATLCCFMEQGSMGILSPDKWFDFEQWVNEGCPLDPDNDDFF